MEECVCPARERSASKSYLKRLKDVGFDGAMLVEAYQRDYGDEKELAESVEYLSALAEKYSESGARLSTGKAGAFFVKFSQFNTARFHISR